MAKFKAAKSKSKSKAASLTQNFRALPCFIILICFFALLVFLFQSVLSNASK